MELSTTIDGTLVTLKTVTGSTNGRAVELLLEIWKDDKVAQFEYFMSYSIPKNLVADYPILFQSFITYALGAGLTIGTTSDRPHDFEWEANRVDQQSIAWELLVSTVRHRSDFEHYDTFDKLVKWIKRLDHGIQTKIGKARY